MKDPRGVERGSCKNCECTAYELEVGATRAACSYCECPAPAHVALTTPAPVIIVESPSNSTTQSESASIPNATSTPSNQNSNIVTLEVSNVSNPFLDSLLSGNSSGNGTTDGPNSDEIFLPIKIPAKVERAFKERKVDGLIKSHLVRHVYANLLGHDQADARCLKKAARKMPQKWSPLKDPTDPECIGLENMLRNRRDTVNSDDSAPSGSTSFDAMTAHDAKKKMKELWESEVRTAAAHREYMVTARPLMKIEVKKLPGLNLFKAYPALGINDILLQEFYAEMDISEQFAEARWRKTLEKLKQHYIDKKLSFVDGSLDEQTSSVLEGLHLASTIWYKEKNKDTGAAKILELHPEGTAPAEMQPKAKDPPRLIGIGSHASGSLSISCYVDSEPWFAEPRPFKAMLMLLAIYFVAKVKWPPLTRLPLVFLTCAVAGRKHVHTDVIRNQKLVDFLKKMGVYEE